MGKINKNKRTSQEGLRMLIRGARSLPSRHRDRSSAMSCSSAL